MTIKSALALTTLCSVLAGCGYLAMATAPKKIASTTRTEAAIQADSVFWETLHGGKYDQIEPALQSLKAAYLEAPQDDLTAAHIAWLHIWRIGESARLPTRSPSLTDDMLLAKRYFQEAVDLHPGEARYLGFLAGVTLAEGSIHKDEKLTRQGYFMLLDSIDAWPEFNLFTAGYSMSRLPPESERFQQALEWQWKSLELCAGEKVNRAAPDYTQYMPLATTQGAKRVCWNSWIAPHNFEGFFLNMGDMLVKAGDWQTAQKIYANAKLSPTYSEWKLGDVLEDRVQHARENVAIFRADSPKADARRAQILIKSPFACMACHQK